MINDKKELFKLLDKIFKRHGYVKKNDTWYRHTDECICFFSIGKSRLDGHYEHILGGFLKELGVTEEFPKYYKCHLRYALDYFLSKERVRQIFDLKDASFKNDERDQAITDLIENHAIPFLQDISTKSGIKGALEKYKSLSFMTNISLKAALGVPYED